MLNTYFLGTEVRGVFRCLLTNLASVCVGSLVPLFATKPLGLFFFGHIQVSLNSDQVPTYFYLYFEMLYWIESLAAYILFSELAQAATLDEVVGPSIIFFLSSLFFPSAHSL